MTTRRRWTEEENAKLIETVELLVSRGEKPAKAHEICGALLDRTPSAVRVQYSVLTKVVEVPEEVEQAAEVTELHEALQTVSNHIEIQEAVKQELKNMVDSLRKENELLKAAHKAVNRNCTELFEGVPVVRDERIFKRGEVWITDLGSYNGCEQGGERPVLIIQNDIGNRHSPTIIVAAITDGKKRELLTHTPIERKGEMTKDSVVLLEQIRTVNKDRLTKKIAKLTQEEMKRVDIKILISMGINL